MTLSSDTLLYIKKVFVIVKQVYTVVNPLPV